MKSSLAKDFFYAFRNEWGQEWFQIEHETMKKKEAKKYN